MDSKKKSHKDKEEFLDIIAYLGDLNKEEEDDRYYHISTNKYSMSFRKWNVLVNIPFSENTMRYYTFKDMIAHFLYEITWYGDEKQTYKTTKKIMSRVPKNK